MPTNTPGNTARRYQEQQVTYLRRTVTFADNGVARTLGIIPAGALIVKPGSGAYVNVAFNAGTSNTINIGTSADDDFYGTLLAAGSIAFVPLDEAVTMAVASDTTITATVVLSGTAASAGSADIVIAYVMGG
jgi:hypothetical protein